MRFVLLALVAGLLPPCSFSQTRARIYVYEQRETPARSSQLILCDGAPAAKIKRGTFFALNVAPGRHALNIETGVPLFVDVRSGNESFVRLNSQIEAGERAVLVLDKVPANVARNEMRFVVYIDSKSALSGSVSKTDPRPPPELHLKRRDEQPPQD